MSINNSLGELNLLNNTTFQYSSIANLIYLNQYLCYYIYSMINTFLFSEVNQSFPFSY